MGSSGVYEEWFVTNETQRRFGARQPHVLLSGLPPLEAWALAGGQSACPEGPTARMGLALASQTPEAVRRRQRWLLALGALQPQAQAGPCLSFSTSKISFLSPLSNFFLCFPSAKGPCVVFFFKV